MTELALLLLLVGVESCFLLEVGRAGCTDLTRSFKFSLVVNDLLGKILANHRAVQRSRADIRGERWPVCEDLRIKAVQKLIPLSDHKVGVKGGRRTHRILMGNG